MPPNASTLFNKLFLKKTAVQNDAVKVISIPFEHQTYLILSIAVFNNYFSFIQIL